MPSPSTPSAPSACSSGCASAGSRPHFVHVSTAYVADRQSGEVAEDGLPHHAVADLEPRADAGRSARVARRGRARVAGRAAGLALRQGGAPGRLDARGPRPGRARRGAARAAGCLGTALAARPAAGDRRRAGPTPTRSARRSANGCWRERSARTTIVRPTIIESALSQPRPGLARGDQGRRPADPRLRGARPHPPARAAPRTGSTSSRSTTSPTPASPPPPIRREERPAHDRDRQQRPQPAGDRRARRSTSANTSAATRCRGATGSRSRSASCSSSTAGWRCARRSAASGSPSRPGAARDRLAGPHPPGAPAARQPRPGGTGDADGEDLRRLHRTRLRLRRRQRPGRWPPRCTEADRAELPFDTAAIDWEDYLQRVHLPEVRRLATEG